MAKQTTTNSLLREFISEENRAYKMRLGSTIASSLAGIACGVIIASIVWYIAFQFVVDMAESACR